MAMRSLLFQPRHPPASHSLLHLRLRPSVSISRLLYRAPQLQLSLCQRLLPACSSPSLTAAESFSSTRALSFPRRKARSSTGSSLKGSEINSSKRPTRCSSLPAAQGLNANPKLKLKKDPTFNVAVVLEDSMDETPELERLLQQLEVDGPLALKLAVEGADNLVSSEMVELSLLICDDSYIQNLNKEWRGKNSPTDVLSFPQEQPPGFSSLWLLGDVIISLDTAKRQAQERGHALLDELRILLVHGLLHVLGYDHEEGPEDAEKMEKEELRILQGLGWSSKGLITASLDETCEEPVMDDLEKSVSKPKGAWKRRPVFKVVLCDMDGTLLNSKSRVTEKTAAALKEAIERGVKVYIATGKTRPAVITAFRSTGLVGDMGVVSETSPGVFVQGLLVYGQQGKVVHNQLLSKDVCIKAFQYSLKERRPLVGFSHDRTVTLFDHPIVEMLHTKYMEPKAEVAPSIDYIIENFPIQKVLFADTVEHVSKVLRPYWSKESGDLARVVQAQADMLEIIPVGSSKGRGVSILLENLGVSPEEVMAIGDGENDIEMLELAGWGVAMRNGAQQTLAVADAQVGSNDEDGVVEALERFVLT